jgi:two-component sensor histidine kinase
MTDTDHADCTQIPVSRPGAIQPFAALVALDRHWRVTCASANAEDLLGLAAHPASRGRLLTDILPPAAVHAIRNAAPLNDGHDVVARVFDVPLAGGRTIDLAIHAQDGGGWVVEAEPHRREPAPLLGLVHRLADRARVCPTLPALLDEAVRGLAALTGFDRVLVYRFASDGSGQVVAETAARGAPRYVGLHFPESDIPAPARALYARNPLRIIADTEALPQAILPLGAAPDLSLSMARAVAPVHLDYLRAMGVRASMSVSLPGDGPGDLWGLVVCHHPRPFCPDYALRSAVELYGQILGHEIAARARRAERDAAATMRALGQDAARGADRALRLLTGLRGHLDCEGLALVAGARIESAGAVPGASVLQALAAAAEGGPVEQAATGRDPGAWGASDRALAVSVTPGVALVVVRTRGRPGQIWAGNPSDARQAGPMRSFAAWRDSAGRRALPFAPSERTMVATLAGALARTRIADLPMVQAPATDQIVSLTVDEAWHRARHALELAAALARSTLSADDAEALAERLAGLARTTTTLGPQTGDPVRLSHLLAAELAPWAQGSRSRADLSGEDAALPPDAVFALTIALHELTANAARHGALSRAVGRIRVRLRMVRGRTRAHLLWVERGGPRPDPSAAPGTGRTIIARAMATLPGGRATLHLGRHGLTARLSFDLRGAVNPAVLVIEDDPLIAADLVRLVAEVGHGPCDVASDAAGAARLLAARAASPEGRGNRPYAAVLCDLALGDDTGWPILSLARSAGSRVIVVSGAHGPQDPAGPFRLVGKPVTRAAIARALAGLPVLED